MDVEILKKVALFDGMTSAQLRKLAAAIREVKFPGSAHIFKEGTEGQFNNLIVTNFTETGMYVTSTASAAAWPTDLFVKNSIFFSNSTNDGVVDFVSPPAADGGVTDIGFDELAKIQAETTDRLGVDPQLTAATNVTAPNFKPASASPVFL